MLVVGWEGIDTGWFHSALGGGKDLRPYGTARQSKQQLEDFEQYLNNNRTLVSVDNTAIARMRGDYAVPTLFNGNFDTITNKFAVHRSHYNRPHRIQPNPQQHRESRHHQQSSGEYQTTLTVMDAYGLKDTKTVTVYVGSTAPSSGEDPRWSNFAPYITDLPVPMIT